MRNLTKEEKIDIFEEAEDLLGMPFDFRLYEDDSRRWYMVIKPPTKEARVH